MAPSMASIVLARPDLLQVLRNHALRRRLIARIVRGEIELPGIEPEHARALLRDLATEDGS